CRGRHPSSPPRRKARSATRSPTSTSPTPSAARARPCSAARRNWSPESGTRRRRSEVRYANPPRDGEGDHPEDGGGGPPLRRIHRGAPPPFRFALWSPSPFRGGFSVTATFQHLGMTYEWAWFIATIIGI